MNYNTASEYKKVLEEQQGYEVDILVAKDDFVFKVWEPRRRLQQQITYTEIEHCGIEVVARKFDQYEQSADTYMHPGATTKELRDPRIREAYEALMIIKKLIGKGYTL